MLMTCVPKLALRVQIVNVFCSWLSTTVIKLSVLLLLLLLLLLILLSSSTECPLQTDNWKKGNEVSCVCFLNYRYCQFVCVLLLSHKFGCQFQTHIGNDLSINRSIDRSIDHSINQSINQSVSQSFESDHLGSYTLNTQNTVRLC